MTRVSLARILPKSPLNKTVLPLGKVNRATDAGNYIKTETADVLNEGIMKNMRLTRHCCKSLSLLEIDYQEQHRHSCKVTNTSVQRLVLALKGGYQRKARQDASFSAVLSATNITQSVLHNCTFNVHVVVSSTLCRIINMI